MVAAFDTLKRAGVRTLSRVCERERKRERGKRESIKEFVS